MIETSAVIDVSALQMLLGALVGWLDHQEREAPIGVRLPGQIFSRRRCGRGGTWSRTTRCSVTDLASRRVQILGSTPHPDDLFMRQVGRTLTAVDDDGLVGHRVVICDRDRKWSPSVRQLLDHAGIRVVRTPLQAPNANAYAERFVRSIRANVWIDWFR